MISMPCLWAVSTIRSYFSQVDLLSWSFQNLPLRSSMSSQGKCCLTQPSPASRAIWSVLSTFQGSASYCRKKFAPYGFTSVSGIVRSGAGSTRAEAAGSRSDGGATMLARISRMISPTKIGGYQRGSGRVFTVAHNSHALGQVLLGIDVGLSAL